MNQSSRLTSTGLVFYLGAAAVSDWNCSFDTQNVNVWFMKTITPLLLKHFLQNGS